VDDKIKEGMKKRDRLHKLARQTNDIYISWIGKVFVFHVGKLRQGYKRLKENIYEMKFTLINHRTLCGKWLEDVSHEMKYRSLSISNI
jgi:predicted nucleic-acid-binding protein